MREKSAAFRAPMGSHSATYQPLRPRAHTKPYKPDIRSSKPFKDQGHT